MRKTLRAGTGLALSLLSAATMAEWRFDFPEPAADLTEQITNLHHMTSWIAFWIMVIILVVVGYSIFRFRKSAGYVPDQEFHHSWWGRWSWLVVPVIVLGIDLSIAGQASKTFAQIESPIEPDLTIKVIGSQWKWTYEYVDYTVDGKPVRFTSNLLSKEEAEAQGEPWLRSVDKPVVLPVNKNIRILNTATDVLHNWWVPQIAPKKDAIPGYINETKAFIKREGTFRGQCAENCGRGHAYMPIVVKAVSEEAFNQWIEEQKQQLAAAAEAAAKTWSKEELMAKGEEVYKKNCMACHQANGMGVPNVFPALKGSKVATGDIAEHIKVVLNGRTGSYGMMPPWRDILNDGEIAAVITYERNAWGNDTGDVVQPSAVGAQR